MKYAVFILLLFISSLAEAQYTVQGKIEFERKINVTRRLDDMDDDQKRWMENFRSQMPKFITSYFDLTFNTENSLYKPGRESDQKSNLWFLQTPAPENTVHTNFKTGQVTAAKQVYEENFLVQDSMRVMKWRITDEIRTIANYKCRKAVGKICDSVYVVAFYTEDIMINGGPEMFSGLPGMILEIAVPRLHTTWIATKVDVALLTEKEFKPPAKGKKTSLIELQKSVGKSTKGWGKDYSQPMVWWVTL